MQLVEVGSTPRHVHIFSANTFETYRSRPMHNTELTIEEIVLGIRQGSLACEEALYRKYRTGVTLLLEKRTQDRARAEDLCQDALLVVLLKLRKGELREAHKLTSYVYQTAKYVYLAWTRLLATKTDRNHEDSQDIAIENNPETLQIRSQEIVETRRLIEEMSVPRDRELLIRHYVNEQNKQEICDALELTASHFDRIIYRARNRFKALLEDREINLKEKNA